MNKPPVRVTVTGAAGKVAYALLFRIGCGDMLGLDQPVELVLLDLPHARKALDGVVMELADCAFPLIANIVATDDPVVAFRDTQIALLISARSRDLDSERLAYLADNARIFATLGAIIGQQAHVDCKVLVVGNPCNTNAYVTMHAASKWGRIPAKNFAAMLRLDHNRALAQLALKSGRALDSLQHLAIWGNHSPLVYADDRFAQSDGCNVSRLIDNIDWEHNTFVRAVGERGGAVLASRGLYAQASAASAVVDQMHDWWLGTQGDWTTMGVVSDGSYGVPEGLIFGFPVTISGGEACIVQGLPMDDFARHMIDANVCELRDELAVVKSVLPALFS